MAEAAAATEKTKKATEDAGKAADTHMGKLVQSATKNRDAWEQTGAGLLGFGAAAVAAVGLAVKTYADFDKSMSSVDAATHETAGNMQLLRNAAVEAGADTSFSAQEAAQGIEELAKAGVATKDILSGGLSGALSLAAAGALGVGQAAEIASSALTQFKLSGDKVPHIADLLAAGAGKAQGSLQDLGAALNQSGLVAASTGLTIEETTGALASFASAGLTGSDAGPSFKTMLMSLNPNSKQAAQLMDQLGIHAYDAQGKFVGMSEYAGILQNALKGLTDEQRNATLKTLFGSDAVRAANILYQEGAAGVSKWEDAVDDAGFAAETAARMQNNLAGDIEKLGGSMDTVFLKSGSGANDFLRGLVQGAEDLVDAIGNVPTPILNAGAAITGVAGIAALVGGAFLTLTPKILDSMQAFKKLAPSGSRARGALAGVGKAAGTATAGLLALQAVGAVFNESHTTSAGEFGQAIRGVAKASNDAAASKGLDIRDLAGAVKEVVNPHIPSGLQDTLDVISNWTGTAKNDLGQVRDKFAGLGEQMGSLAKNGAADVAAKSFQTLTKEFEKNGKGAKVALDVLPGYKEALQGLANKANVTLTSQELLDLAMGKVPASMQAAAAASKGAADGVSGLGAAASGAVPLTEEVTKALEDIGVSADGTVTNLTNFTVALINAGLLTLSARDATAKFDEGLDSLKGKIDTIMATEQAHGGVLNETKTDLDLMSEAGRAANDVLTDMTTRGLNAAKATAANGESQDAIQRKLNKTYDAMVTTAKGFGLSDAAANTLTRSILHIPEGVSVDSWMSSQAKTMAEQTTGAINNIPKNVEINETYNKRINEIIQRSTLPDLNGDASGSGRPGLFRGGRVRDVVGFAEGGIVPGTAPSDPTQDNVLAMVNGQPLKVRSGEWIINEKSSRKYDGVLAAINAGTFRGYAEGGRVGWSQPTFSVAAPAFPSSLRLVVHGHEFTAYVDGRVGSGMDRVASVASGRIR
ncbi:phage tail tape measure protein [Arthrobacter sp. 8AJ]|uniref:phage tail tape measure protein n=1 Tax=Arthrobacter sp. 8AJ TaxID=2653130 RepID=UPI00135C8AE0|nr:phage tail tape measure protein [Arthrobacter sp. 8AJ]